MEKFYIDNMEFIIREATKTDAKALIDYLDKIAQESDFLSFGIGELNITLEKEETFLENSYNQDNSLMALVMHGERIIGTASMAGGIKPRFRHVGEMGISVIKAYWGKGIGEKMIDYMVGWSKQTAIIRKINLYVRSDNVRALNLYKKTGFEVEGAVRRDMLIGNEFYDSIMMGMLID
ncbi:MAG TPA: N-acetyltransferase [Clostridiales bacterium]|jgi:RimJ/RimL family protein N-acetyltransferase|nr:N-acetyltransferase [Clostridiales bacterium]